MRKDRFFLKPLSMSCIFYLKCLSLNMRRQAVQENWVTRRIYLNERSFFSLFLFSPSPRHAWWAWFVLCYALLGCSYFQKPHGFLKVRISLRARWQQHKYEKLIFFYIFPSDEELYHLSAFLLLPKSKKKDLLPFFSHHKQHENFHGFLDDFCKVFVFLLCLTSCFSVTTIEYTASKKPE